MVFGSPIWLICLLPWGILAAYLLPGRGVLAVVPFVKFWKSAGGQSRVRARRLPHISMLLMFLALLLIIIAAAEPAMRNGKSTSGTISIILDRGNTMSKPSISNKPFRGVLRRCSDRLHFSNDQQISLLPVPGNHVELTGQNWESAANRFSPTALRVNLDQAIATQLNQTTGPIVVLTDQNIDLVDRRIVQILPEPAADSVAITALSAQVWPHPQAMVRLQNLSGWKSVHLTVQSGTAVSQTDVRLPMSGQSVTQFVDLATLGDSISAVITPHLSTDPGAYAFAVQTASGVQLVVDSGVDDAIKKIAAIYAKDRPIGSQPHQAIVSNHPLPIDVPGVWNNPVASTEPLTQAAAAGPNIITRNVTTWPTAGASIAPPAGFNPVVSIGQTAIVAIRENPARQVWLNADLSEWEKTPDFVIFFGNIFDWISASDVQFRSDSPAMLGPSWHKAEGPNDPPGVQPGALPGIYQSDTGQRIAINAGEVPAFAPTASVATRAQSIHRTEGRFPMQNGAIFCAFASILTAVLTWPRHARGGMPVEDGYEFLSKTAPAFKRPKG